MHDRTAPEWRKSTKSASGNCVEIMKTEDKVLMRDSKDPSGPVLSFDRDAFEAFIADLKAEGPFGG